LLDLFAPTSQPPCWLPGTRSPSVLQTDRLKRRHRQWARQRTDRLFFAVLPDEETAERIGNLARHLRASHGLTGRTLETRHLHVTLHHVGDDFGPPPTDLIEALTQRAAAVAMPRFRVVFDRAESFRNGALVLRGDDGMIGLDVLQQRLSDALDGRPRPARAFTPHLTLLRDQHRVPEQAIEPIEWTVREIVLVHSLLGRTTHRHIARLPLAH
jgi:2'-5' RNA ligase